jgi:hypothetical protein
MNYVLREDKKGIVGLWDCRIVVKPRILSIKRILSQTCCKPSTKKNRILETHPFQKKKTSSVPMSQFSLAAL